MRVLSICPTKGRSELCAQMVQSFNKTAKENNILVLGMNFGDPHLTYYNDIKEHKVVCKANATVTEVVNDIYKMYPNYDFYHILNDDVIYHTNGWDTKFIQVIKECGPGIAYGNDLFQGKNLPTFPFISKELVKSIGWLQLPRLNRYFGDMVWRHIGQMTNTLYYLGGVEIEHMHNLADKSDIVPDMEVYDADQLAWASWLPSSHIDINRIKEALSGKAVQP